MPPGQDCPDTIWSMIVSNVYIVGRFTDRLNGRVHLLWFLPEEGVDMASSKNWFSAWHCALPSCRNRPERPMRTGSLPRPAYMKGLYFSSVVACPLNRLQDCQSCLLLLLYIRAKIIFMRKANKSEVCWRDVVGMRSTTQRVAARFTSASCICSRNLGHSF